MRAWGIDFHVWSNLKGKLSMLANNGMSYVIFKVTMGYGDAPAADIADFFNEVSKTNLIAGVYGWIDPTGNLDDEIKRFTNIINTYKPKLVNADYEQWWSDWSMYYKLLNEMVTMDQVPKIDKIVNANFGKAYCDAINAVRGNALFQVYTNAGFVNSWAPTAKTWLCQDPTRSYPGYYQWDAGTPYYNTIVKFTDWPSFNGWLDNRPEPVGASVYGMKVKSRQITSQITPPDLSVNVDFNVWIVPGAWATQEQMRTEINALVPTPPPTPSPIYVTAADLALALKPLQDSLTDIKNSLSNLQAENAKRISDNVATNGRIDILNDTVAQREKEISDIDLRIKTAGNSLL